MNAGDDPFRTLIQVPSPSRLYPFLLPCSQFPILEYVAISILAFYCFFCFMCFAVSCMPFCDMLVSPPLFLASLLFPPLFSQAKLQCIYGIALLLLHNVARFWSMQYCQRVWLWFLIWSSGVWATKPIFRGRKFGPFAGDKKKRSQVKSNVYMWEVSSNGWAIPFLYIMIWKFYNPFFKK